MDYLSVGEVSKIWSISGRRIQKLCEEGRIKGAFRFGRSWAIPKDAQKPIDGRLRDIRNKTI